MRFTGTKVIGVRAPIITEGDDIVDVVVNSIKSAVDNDELTIDDRDVIGITESVVARAQGNYVSVDDVADSVKEHFGENADITVIFPIMSRNRFSIILKGIARAAKKVNIVFKAPCDEVGNELVNVVNFPHDYISESAFVNVYGEPKHRFTGVNYFKLYRDMIEKENSKCKIYAVEENKFLRGFGSILSTNIIYAGIHDIDEKINAITQNFQLSNYTPKIISLADICKGKNLKSNCGYNSDYGVLGSNKADEETLKLFPTSMHCNLVCETIQKKIKELYNKDVEVLVYGDGCFKDPIGGIWEFADPVTTPGYTAGLVGTPNELKLKYLADNDYKDSENKENSIKDAIKNKQENLVGNMASQGTTPRRYVDLLASLFDLVSGSGDKGTPIVIAKGYFDNYATD